MDKQDAVSRVLNNDLPIPEGPMTDQSGLGLPAPIPAPPKEVIDNIIKVAPNTLPSDNKSAK